MPLTYRIVAVLDLMGKWDPTMMAMRRFGLMTVLLATKAAFCSPPDACSLTSRVTDAKLALSLVDARTSYREGEIIQLVLSFTSIVDKPGQGCRVWRAISR